jgi:hypothetical protein
VKRAGPAPSSQLPDPARFWVRWRPRLWPAPEEPRDWVDLGAGCLGEIGGGTAGIGLEPLSLGGPPLDDLLYLPPVPEELAAGREALARERLADGTPVLLQALAGETSPGVPGATVVWDPLAALLAGDLGRLGQVPAGGAAVWPLLSGVSDDPRLWEEGCARLAAAGVRWAQALAPRLTPADRRRLVDRVGEGSFEAVFHGELPAERDFARVARRHGLEPFLPRPLPRPPIQGAKNRRLAGVLALAAELWLRIERPVGQGQALYSAARQADSTSYDLGALAREGNLGVLGWLDPIGKDLVEELAADGRSSLLQELLEEYVR